MASTDYQATGTVHVVGDLRVISEKFSVREFTIEIPDERYPQLVTFQASNKRLNIVEGLQQGATITVHFNLRGREWTNPQGQVRYFNTLDAWRLEHVGAGPASFDKPGAAPGAGQDIPF